MCAEHARCINAVGDAEERVQRERECVCIHRCGSCAEGMLKQTSEIESYNAGESGEVTVEQVVMCRAWGRGRTESHTESFGDRRLH